MSAWLCKSGTKGEGEELEGVENVDIADVGMATVIPPRVGAANAVADATAWRCVLSSSWPAFSVVSFAEGKMVQEGQELIALGQKKKKPSTVFKPSYAL